MSLPITVSGSVRLYVRRLIAKERVQYVCSTVSYFIQHGLYSMAACAFCRSSSWTSSHLSGGIRPFRQVLLHR